MSNMKTKNYEINDMELDTVNGGYYLYANAFDTPEEVAYRFLIGNTVELVTACIWRPFTQTCTVIDRKVGDFPDGKGYCAWYKVSCENEKYNNQWFPERRFEGGFYNWEAGSNP